MQQYDHESVMTVEEARMVAERFVQGPDFRDGHVSVSELAGSLHARREQIEKLLSEVRGKHAYEQARGREHRNVWITGLAALGVGCVFMTVIFATRSHAGPSIIIDGGPPVMWDDSMPPAEAPMASEFVTEAVPPEPWPGAHAPRDPRDPSALGAPPVAPRSGR